MPEQELKDNKQALVALAVQRALEHAVRNETDKKIYLERGEYVLVQANTVAEDDSRIEELDTVTYKGDVILIIRRADHPTKPEPLFGPPPAPTEADKFEAAAREAFEAGLAGDKIDPTTAHAYIKSGFPNVQNICRECEKFPRGMNTRKDGQLCITCNSAPVPRSTLRMGLDHGSRGQGTTMVQFRVGGSMVDAESPLYVKLLARTICDAATASAPELQPLGDLLLDFVDRFAEIPREQKARRFELDFNRNQVLIKGEPLGYRGGEVVDAIDHDAIVADYQKEAESLRRAVDGLSTGRPYVPEQDSPRVKALERLAQSVQAYIDHGEIGGHEGMWRRVNELQRRLRDVEDPPRIKVADDLDASLREIRQLRARIRFLLDQFNRIEELELTHMEKLEAVAKKAMVLRELWLKEGLNGDLSGPLGNLDTALKVLEGRP